MDYILQNQTTRHRERSAAIQHDRLYHSSYYSKDWIPAFAGMTGRRGYSETLREIRNIQGMEQESGFAILQNRKADWPSRIVAREALAALERR